jgi:hypothetical protein
MAQGEHGVLILQLSDNEPLIEELAIAKTADGPTSLRPLFAASQLGRRASAILLSVDSLCTSATLSVKTCFGRISENLCSGAPD